MTADLPEDLMLGEVPSGADALLPALWRSREVRWSAVSGLLSL